MPLAAIFFDFDPTIDLGDRSITLWSLLVIAGLVVALASAAFLAAREGSDGDSGLSQVDLWMIVLGIVPGAVIGGRIGYLLIHLGYYSQMPNAIVDATQGAFQLSCAVVGGALTGAYVARVIEAPVGRWLHVAAFPALGVIVIGKVGMALGGAGQGQPSDGAWTTAYLGDGPWGSLAPAIPSAPAQLYEAGATFSVLVVVLAIVAAGRLRRPDGSLFLVAIELWLVARFLVAFTWRDEAVIGPLVADQIVSLALLGGCLAIQFGFWRAHRRAVPPMAVGTEGQPVAAVETESQRPPGSRI